MIGVQLSLFDTPTFNVSISLKETMNRAAKTCGLSREEIVDRMNILAERYGVCLVKGNCRKLSRETLEKWLNPADPSRQMPAKAIPIFNAIVDNADTLNILAQPTGHRVIGHKDQRLLEWARAYRQARAARRTMRQLEADL